MKRYPRQTPTVGRVTLEGGAGTSSRIITTGPVGHFCIPGCTFTQGHMEDPGFLYKSAIWDSGSGLPIGRSVDYLARQEDDIEIV